MRIFISMMLALTLLLGAACAETVTEAGEAISQTPYDPIPWSERVSPNLPDQSCYLPDDAGYHDDSIDVRLSTFRADNGTKVYAMYVTLTDPSQFRAGTQSTRPPYQQENYVWRMSEHFNAVCAINDDYFGYHTEGIVIRNGEMLRNRPTIRRDQLIVDDKGDFHIITDTTKAKWAEYTGTVVHTFCFGPGLVVDGVLNTECQKTKMNVGPNKKTQRIAIGQMGPLQYLILATDGPDNEKNAGLTLQEMANLCYQQGMINAYNLDGGSSSSLVLNNKKINGVGSKRRKVGGCIWFATLVPNK